MVEGRIFNIQPFSIHDGPGIRTTVFVKGCPLRCRWCQNPESQQGQPELFFHADRCVGCGKCAAACDQGAIEIRDGRSWTDRDLCDGAGACVEACPNDARELVGREAAVAEIFDQVMADEIFYQQSGGGVTLSGGEPLAQPEFVIDLLKRCKEAGLNTVLDTCGHAGWKTVKRVMEYVDLVLYDFKHMDPAAHERLTGVTNFLILSNAKRIHHQLGVPMRARISIVPGYNDGEENIAATAEFVATELDRSVEIHLLPYHRLGDAKREQLQWSEQSLAIEQPSDGHMAKLKTIFESHGLTAHIGG